MFTEAADAYDKYIDSPDFRHRLPGNTTMRRDAAAAMDKFPKVPSRWPAMFILAFADLGDAVFRSARLFLIEQGLCRAYYLIEDPSLIAPDGSIEEYRCKSDSLQANLSMIYGLFDVVTLLCGLVATPAYTRLISTVGIRYILLVNLCSMAVGAFYCTAVFFFGFDVRWILLTGLFDLIGGGQPVRNTLLYTYIAEVVPSDYLSETLYRMSTLVLTMGFSGTILGAALLNINVWLLCGIGISARALAVPLALLLASPRRVENQAQSLPFDGSRHHYSAVPHVEDGRSPSRADAGHTPPIRTRSLSETLSAIMTEASLTLSLLTQLFRDPLTRVTMLIYLFDEVAIYVRIVFPQWATKRFEWSLAEANGITSFQIVVNAAVLVFLPYISRVILRPILGSQQLVDLWAVKGSLAMNVMGIICVGVAPLRTLYITSMLVYNLGSALTDALRSFVTSTMRDAKEIERLYMGISMVETIAGLVGTMLWTSVFSASLRYGGITLGRIPFFAAAVLFGISLWLTNVIQRLAAKRNLEITDVDEDLIN